MTKYQCDNCEYASNSKRSYEAHINRIFPCSPNNLHKNTKQVKDIKCELCDKNFTTGFSLNRHNNTCHADTINKSNVSNANTVEGDPTINNTTTKASYNTSDSHNTNIENIETLIINIDKTDLHKYLYANINDLSILEQYLSLAYGIIPYRNIMDNLNFHPDKPQYHNIKPDTTKKIYVYNGVEWINERIDDAIGGIIKTGRTILCSIFNRFRLFLGIRYHKYHIYHLYTGLPSCKKEYKTLADQIMCHIGNKKGPKRYPEFTDKNKPDANDPIWQHLSKTFTWNEVQTYLIEMDKMDINFDQNLSNINKQIISYIKANNDKKMQALFKKLVDRIKLLVSQYEVKPDSTSSSESVESDNDEDRISQRRPTDTFEKEIESIPIETDNVIRYHGSKYITKEKTEHMQDFEERKSTKKTSKKPKKK